MSDATFDGANLHITLPSIGTFDAQTNIYSAWKEWIRQSDNAKYPIAFDTTGGDDVGGGQTVAPYFFCRNDLGWRIKMPSADGEIVVSGNLFPRDASANLFEQTVGYDAFLRLEVSTRAIVATVSTGSGLSTEQDAVINAIAAKVAQITINEGLVQSNLKQFNDVDFQGDGTPGNDLRPVGVDPQPVE